jgi:hypothetical protein
LSEHEAASTAAIKFSPGSSASSSASTLPTGDGVSQEEGGEQGQLVAVSVSPPSQRITSQLNNSGRVQSLPQLAPGSPRNSSLASRPAAVSPQASKQSSRQVVNSTSRNQSNSFILNV